MGHVFRVGPSVTCLLSGDGPLVFSPVCVRSLWLSLVPPRPDGCPSLPVTDEGFRRYSGPNQVGPYLPESGDRVLPEV